MSLSAEQIDALEDRLLQWEGTPYMAGQCKPGPKGGVDCVRLVDDALQYALGLSLPPLPREAQDAAFHNREIVQQVQRLILNRFNGVSLPLDVELQPGDILGVRKKDAEKFHHVYIVGPDCVKCYHATRPVVCWTGIGGVRATHTIVKIWRSML